MSRWRTLPSADTRSRLTRPVAKGPVGSGVRTAYWSPTAASSITNPGASISSSPSTIVLPTAYAMLGAGPIGTSVVAVGWLGPTGPSATRSWLIKSVGTATAAATSTAPATAPARRRRRAMTPARMARSTTPGGSAAGPRPPRTRVAARPGRSRRSPLAGQARLIQVDPDLGERSARVALDGAGVELQRKRRLGDREILEEAQHEHGTLHARQPGEQPPQLVAIGRLLGDIPYARSPLSRTVVHRTSAGATTTCRSSPSPGARTRARNQGHGSACHATYTFVSVTWSRSSAS